MMMTAFFPQDRILSQAETVAALARAQSGTLDYYAAPPSSAPIALQDLSPLDVMFAYFGSNEAAS